MNDMSDNVQHPTYSNNFDEVDENSGTNSPNAGITEKGKNGLTLVMVHGNNQNGVHEPMDMSEEDFELVDIENMDDPRLTRSNACEYCERKWEDEKAKLEKSLQAEQQKVNDMEDTLKKRTEEMEKKNETDLLKYNAEKRKWENEKAELLKSLQAEKQKVNDMEDTLRKTTEEMDKKNETQLNQLSNAWDVYCKGLIQQHTNEKQILLHTVETLKVEKDNLLTRLSNIAADMLTHGNVNIVDLSNADRPTKLQEVYSELYDNGWTDALEELQNKNFPDKDVIVILLDILMSSFQKCREITWGRYEKLRYVASSVEILQRIPMSAAEKLFEGTKDLGIDLEKQIKDIWRKTTVAIKENLIEQIYSEIETCQKIPRKDWPITSKYLKSCVNLCWKMGFQERPMHLDTVAEMEDDHGKKFDTNKFKAYTRSGRNVAFVVWPALFLYEGGPMLAKGIAQGCSNDEIQNAEMHS